MSDPTRYFLASFPGHGEALFSKVEWAMEWCDRRAEERYPGAVEWPEPGEEAEENGATQGKRVPEWIGQVPKAGHNVPPLSLGSVKPLPLDPQI